MNAAAPEPHRSPATVVPRLRARDLRRRFKERTALDGVGFEVAPGEILGLLGPNGAGKSTVFRILSGLLRPDGGTLERDGAPASPASAAFRARLGVVFQDPSIDLKLTARENLRLGAALYGLSRATARPRIEQALALMEMGARADEPASHYSGGMRRRLEIARVLLHQPDLLLLDEPGRGVDPDALRRIWDLLQQLRREQGVSIVVTTHQPEEAERCDRIVLLDRGRVCAEGTADELRARVAGEVLHISSDEPNEVAAVLRERLALSPRVVDREVVVEAARAHELVPRVVELFPPGRLRSVATSRPTLADVFAKLTGHGFNAEEAPAR